MVVVPSCYTAELVVNLPYACIDGVVKLFDGRGDNMMVVVVTAIMLLMMMVKW